MDKKMGVSEHLSDLRGVLAPLAILYAVMAAGIYTAFPEEVAISSSHLADGMRLVSFSPTEYLQTRLYTAFAGALLLSSPFAAFGIYRFVSPGLMSNERRFAYIYAPISIALIFAATALSYAFISPLAIRSLMDYGNGIATPMISISKLASFSIIVAAIAAAVFQVPLAISILYAMGIVNRKMLGQWRKYFYAVSIAIAFSVVSPPALSLLAAVFMIASYEASLLAGGMVWH